MTNRKKGPIKGMAIYTGNLNMRLDKKCGLSLKKLSDHFQLTKSEIIRKSLVLMEKMIDIEKYYGEIRLITKEGKEIIILLT